MLLADQLHRRGSLSAAAERHLAPALIVRDDKIVLSSPPQTVGK
jgi:hypothetical protein